MSGRYLYCQKCGEYLGSLGGDECQICDWREQPDARELTPSSNRYWHWTPQELAEQRDQQERQVNNPMEQQ